MFKPVFEPNLPDDSWDFESLCGLFPELELLSSCHQNPEFHAEDDVETHTRMVMEKLLSDPEYHLLNPAQRQETFLAAVLHDVAKPFCTKLVAGKLTSPGHARLGSQVARRLLWQAKAPVATRERICALIFYHLHPFWAYERDDADVAALSTSWKTSCRQLAILARADGCGRLSSSTAQMAEAVDFYKNWCQELSVLDSPFPFANDTARVQFFAKRAAGVDRDPFYTPYDDSTSTVTVMSGLPGSGKDTWIAQHAKDLAVVSLDAFRVSLGIKPTDPQHKVVFEAREEAKRLLRSHTDFVWNATNVGLQQRSAVVALALAYNARVRIVAVDCAPETLRSRNASRKAHVPESVLDKLVRRWEYPDLTEAHELLVVEN